MENTGTVVAGPENGFDYTVPLRVQRLDAARGALLCVVIVAVASVFSFNMMSFLHAKEAALCIGLVLMAGLVMMRGQFYTNGLTSFAPLWGLLGVALIRAAVLPTAVASDVAVAVLRAALVLLAVALTYDLLAQEKWRGSVLDALIASALVVAILGAVQYLNLAPRLFPAFSFYSQRVYSVFGNQDYLGGYVAMVLPACLYRAQGERKWQWGVLSFLLLMPVLLISGSRSAWLAAMAGLLMMTPHMVRRLRRNAIIAAFTAVLAATLVALAPEATVWRVQSAFAQHDEGRDTRLWLWQAGHGMFRDRPLLGVGPGNYAYWSPLYLGEIAVAHPEDPGFDIERHADQPHSELVRVVAETGMVGLFFCAWMAMRLLGTRGGAEWSVLAAFGTFALFNGVFDSVPHTLAAALMAGMLLARPASAFWESARLARLLPVGVAAVCLVQVWAVLAPSAWLARADDALRADEPSLGLYERVTRHPWPNALARKKHAQALADAGRGPEAYVQYLYALKGLDTGDIYLELAELTLNGDDRASARIWINEALKRWPNNQRILQMDRQMNTPGRRDHARDHALDRV